MTRRSFTAPSVVSLLLFVAAIVAWPRTWKFGDTLGYTTASDRRYSIGSAPGRIALGFVRHTPPMAPSRGWPASSVRWGTFKREVVLIISPPTPPRVTTVWMEQQWRLPAHEFLGLGWDSGTSSSGPPFFPRPVTIGTAQVVVPFWLILLLTAVLPTAWLGRRLRSRARRRKGQSPACGYDLRANSDRCPECGTPMMSNRGTTA